MTKPLITPDVLDRIDVRVGTILKVDDVAGSDKLVALRVSFGDHERTIVAGMKRERENPREIEGRQALFVVNLVLAVLVFGLLDSGVFIRGSGRQRTTLEARATRAAVTS